jgi:ABC-2 type transport system permease protein
MSLRRLWAVTQKEFIHIKRDARTLVIVLIMPLLQLILMGYTTANDVKHVPLAVCDLSRTAASRDFVAGYRATDVFDVRYMDGSEREMARLLDDGQIEAGLIIPQDYADTLAAGRKAQVAFYLDGSNPIVALTALNSAELIAQSQSTEIMQRWLRNNAGLLRGGVDVRPAVWYNPNLTQANFIVPALVGMVIQNFMTQLVVGAIVREREKGTLEQLVATPLRSLELIVGKVIPYIGLALVAALEILAVGLTWFQVPVRGNLLLLIVYALFFLAAMLGWAVLISAVAHTDQEARTMNLLIMLPSMFLSGMFFPRSGMPRVLQLIGELVPMTHFLVMVRAVVLKGVGLVVVMPQVFALTAFAFVVIWLAARSFQRKIG